MKIFNKRNRWCVRDDNGKLWKFNSESEARNFYEPAAETLTLVEDIFAEDEVFHEGL